MKHRRNLVIGVILTVAATATVLTTVSAPSNEVPVEENGTSTLTLEAPPTDTASPSQGNCAYQWAYQDAPELTASFDAAVKALNPEANGHVTFYGENCIYADGTSTFLTMETDFYVRLQVEDLSREEDFGNWVAQVMESVVQIPREELPGNYGFVEFWFEKNENEHVIVRVPIQQYLNEGQGKTGVELFEMYSSPP